MPETRNVTIDVLPERPRAQIVFAERMRRYAMEYASLQDTGWMIASAMSSWGPTTIKQAASPPVPDEGYAIETIKHTSFYGFGRWNLDKRHVLLFMGGSWAKGGWNTQTSPQCFCSIDPETNAARPLAWDRANQPTRWKPLPR